MNTIVVVFISLPGVKLCISMIEFIQTVSFSKQMSSNCERYWLSAVKISIEWVSQSCLAKIQHIQHQALIEIAWPVDHWWRIYASASSAIIVSGVYMMSQNNPVYTRYAICSHFPFSSTDSACRLGAITRNGRFPKDIILTECSHLPLISFLHH